MSLLGYPKIIPAKSEHFGSFVFELGYAAEKQTDRQTDKQTNSLERPIHPTDIIGVGNNILLCNLQAIRFVSALQ